MVGQQVERVRQHEFRVLLHHRAALPTLRRRRRRRRRSTPPEAADVHSSPIDGSFPNATDLLRRAKRRKACQLKTPGGYPHSSPIDKCFPHAADVLRRVTRDCVPAEDPRIALGEYSHLLPLTNCSGKAFTPAAAHKLLQNLQRGVLVVILRVAPGEEQHRCILRCSRSVLQHLNDNTNLLDLRFTILIWGYRIRDPDSCRFSIIEVAVVEPETRANRYLQI